MMKRLSDEQKRLVQDHLHVIDWVLYKSIVVNETVQGLGREDCIKPAAWPSAKRLCPSTDGHSSRLMPKHS